MTPTNKPARHHLDRRADAIVAAISAPMTTAVNEAVARWLGVNIQFLEIGRHKGYAQASRKSRRVTFGNHAAMCCSGCSRARMHRPLSIARCADDRRAF